MKAVRVFPLVLVVVLLVAAPVSAAPPVVETFEFEWDYVPFDRSPCPGIEIRDHEVGTYRVTSYSDNQGNVVRTQIQIAGTASLYNPANPEVVLSGSFVHNIFIDLRTAEVFHFGAPYHITAPGYGTVLVAAGRWFTDGRMVGKHSITSATDMEQLCSLLAGD